ncbi:SBBP repeat-containing protein [Polyangium sp. y55x31]|uniref:SBBP repeat-containing protein n=1 Tax=Polyangium sp. y55x31 TaxID=3042688 RepID=UPI002482CBE7|nr:SBBP repeat-containing protein [Polyangium sp. y55x31]MDI1478385.1 SBBP repeat-containing protein [Polyangium sp. y55x31]
MDIAVDPQGNLIVTGKFDGVLDFGGASLVCRELEDVFVVKLDTSGNPIWSKAMGGDDEQTVQRIAVDSEGNILLVGYFRGTLDLGGGSLVSAGSRDIFAAKLAPDGGHIWSKSFGGPNTQLGRGIAADDEGNVFIAGTIWGSADFGGGPLTSAGWEDMFVAKLDKDGKHLWSRTFGDQETQEAWDLATDSEGNVVVTGYALGTVDFGDGPTVGTGMPDAILVKLSANGSTLWSHRFGDSGKQFGQSVAVDPGDHVIMSGEFQGTVDFGDGLVVSAGAHDLFVVKFNPTGELEWYRRVGDASDQSSISVAADGAGAVLLTGSFEGGIDFGDTLLVSAGLTDAFVAKLDPAGNALWSLRMGDEATQAGTGITADPEGNVFVAGKMWGTIALGNASVTTTGDGASDMFVARFSP